MCKLSNILRDEFEKFENQPDCFINTWSANPPLGSLAEKAINTGKFTVNSLSIEVPSILSLFIPSPSQSPQIGISGYSLEELKNLDQLKMLEIMGKVDLMMTSMAQSCETAVKAHVVSSKYDQCQYLVAYLEIFPDFVFGGRTRLHVNFCQNPDPMTIFETYRIRFVHSFRKIIPPPLFHRICKILDHDSNVKWVITFLSSQDFRDMISIVKQVFDMEEFESLKGIQPEDWTLKKPGMLNARNRIQRKLEEESKKFWTYEKIGNHLKA
ncbi:unnamed protein product [Caenorhabditis angaria]|uniref:Uncharacterized protein n=1 Tax=Caenorhabditis angaria TaxID=860376 RepID=A0A9P1IXJ7_9PELO|nr:unnamed protein product [Caenorhabditis angaria]